MPRRYARGYGLCVRTQHPWPPDIRCLPEKLSQPISVFYHGYSSGGLSTIGKTSGKACRRGRLRYEGRPTTIEETSIKYACRDPL